MKFVGDKDPLLVHAVGRLDVKLFGSLADDLDRLRLDARVLLDGSAERLDLELLLGLPRRKSVCGGRCSPA